MSSMLPFLWSAKKAAEMDEDKLKIEAEQTEEHTPLRHSMAIGEEHRKKQAEEMKQNRIRFKDEPLQKTVTSAPH